jgi:hypothetical protein
MTTMSIQSKLTLSKEREVTLSKEREDDFPLMVTLSALNHADGGGHSPGACAGPMLLQPSRPGQLQHVQKMRPHETE